MVGGAIDSILKQTFPDFELIVVDDCSQDDTGKIVRSRADSRIRYFRHDSGRLIAVNRNFGMSLAEGEYIAFSDDDDLWLPEKLEIELAAFAGDGSIGMVCSDGILFNQAGDINVIYKGRFRDGFFTFDTILKYDPVLTPSVLVKKAVIDGVGGMSTNPVFRVGEDYEYWLRISRKYKIRYLDLPLVKVRRHAGQLHMSGATSTRHIRRIYRWLRDADYIDGRRYWWLVLRMLAIELLWRTRTIRLASWLWWGPLKIFSRRTTSG